MSDSPDNDVGPFEFNAEGLACYREQATLQQLPLLFLLLAFYADQQHWSTQQLTNCSQQQAVDILTAIKLPTTEATCWVLKRSCLVARIDQPGTFERSELAVLYQFFNSNIARLLNKKSIPREINRLIQLAELLAHFPDLVTARFIKHSSGKEVRLYTGLPTLLSIHRLAQQLSITNIARRIRRCRHTKELSLLRRKLENRASDMIVNDLAKIGLDDLDIVINCVGVWLSDFDRQELEQHWFDVYDSSPLLGNVNILALLSYQALFLESHQQHNCAAFYQFKVQDEGYAIFSILAPERATLGLTFNEKKQRYQIDQLLLRDNQPVSTTTRRAIKHWLQQAQQRPSE